MVNRVLKSDKSKYSVDLWIITLSCSMFYGTLGIFYMLLKFDMGRFPVLVQTLIGAVFEFGCMGLGITIVCIRNKESFTSFGLKKEKLLLTIVLSALVCLPQFIFDLSTSETITYFPLQNVNFTKSILAADFPVNILGMLIIIITWGFFEGFSYVVMSDRINKRFPSEKIFINWGAIVCGIFCLLIHLLVGQSYSMAGAITEFVLIYGMLMVYRYTGNAWGCVFIFCFFWSGIGS